MTGAAASSQAEGNSQCNNNGVVIQAGVKNEYRCEANVQICENTTGAGAGAGAGGPAKENEAGAEAAAGGQCQQNNDGNLTCYSLYTEMQCSPEQGLGSGSEF
jgi:hypothetical protein